MKAVHNWLVTHPIAWGLILPLQTNWGLKILLHRRGDLVAGQNSRQ
jgi:hypothetical protein